VDQIYRVIDDIKFSEDLAPGAFIPSGWADGFEDIPDIVSIGRIRQATRFNPLVKYDNRVFTEDNFIFIDSTLLNILDHDFIFKKGGNPLSYPNAIIISQRIATKYFGINDPIDKVLQVDNDKERQ